MLTQYIPYSYHSCPRYALRGIEWDVDLMVVNERWQKSVWQGERVDAIEKPTGRDAFFTAVTCCLLNIKGQLTIQRDKKNALQALFFVPELGNLTPSNLAYSSFELLGILVEYQCLPYLLHLSCTSFMELGFWDRKEEVFSLLSVLFSRVSHLAIDEGNIYDIYRDSEQLSKVFRFLLEAVFYDSKKRPAVTRFKLKADNDAFLDKALHHMADIMSPRSSCGYFTSNLYTQYNGLRLLAVSASRGKGTLHSRSDPSIDLRMVIEYQTELHTLYIQDSVGSNPVSASLEYDKLMDCLGSLFRKPTFFRLGLFNVSFQHSSGINALCFEDIMHKFLCSPIQGQELELSSEWTLSLDGCGGSNMSSLVVPPNVVSRSKSLLIGAEIEDCQWVNPFFCCRLPIFPLNSLGYLFLEGLNNLTEDTLATILSLNLTALHFESCFLLRFAQSPLIAQLFTMPNLTSIMIHDADRLIAIDNVMEQFMDTVTQGLLQQASLAKITLLDLSNKLSYLSNRCLRELFNAIFRLPQLESLTLVLENNSFVESHMQLLCQSWCEEADGRRLLELHVCKQKCEGCACLSDFNKLAVSVTCINVE